MFTHISRPQLHEFPGFFQSSERTLDVVFRPRGAEKVDGPRDDFYPVAGRMVPDKLTSSI